MLTATNCVRFGAIGARGLQLQTSLAGGTSPSLKTLAQRQFTTTKQISTKTLPVSKLPLQCRFNARRAASTNTATTNRAAEAKALDWNSFFALRKSRRRFQVVCSVATMAIGGSMSGLVLINADMEWLGKIPLDPFITLGLMTMGCAALGWLAGPSLGSVIFYTVKNGVKTPMAIKEVEFFARIKKNRVDPSVSSVGNPVPDYYGEKISSVAGYRQWLKDQRAFNKKRTSFV